MMSFSKQTLLDKALRFLRRLHGWAVAARDDEAAFRAYEEHYGKADPAMWRGVMGDLEISLERAWDPDMNERLKIAHFAGTIAARRSVLEELESFLEENALGHVVGLARKEPRRPVLVVDNTKREIPSSDEGEQAAPDSPGAA